MKHLPLDSWETQKIQPQGWMVHEDGYGILEYHPKYQDGVAMLCRCAHEKEAEYTVAAHEAAIAAEQQAASNAFTKGYDQGHADATAAERRALEAIRNRTDGNRGNCLACCFSFNTATDALAKGEGGK